MPLSTACWDTCCPKHLASELIGFPGVQVKLSYGSHPVLGPPVGRPCSKIIFRETYSAVTYNSQEGHFLGCVCSCLVPAARRLQLFPCLSESSFCCSTCLHMVKDAVVLTNLAGIIIPSWQILPLT